MGMKDIWFTADTHFNHPKIIEYCNRPFTDVDSMNDCMVKNWNLIVRPGDTVYHLGDMGFYTLNTLKNKNRLKSNSTLNTLSNIINSLHGNIILIPGSHDTSVLQRLQRESRITISTSGIKDITVNGHPITLCHYPMRSWRASFHGSWHLFGHEHGRVQPVGYSMDVGVDCNGFTPVSLGLIETVMAERKEIAARFEVIPDGAEKDPLR